MAKLQLTVTMMNILVAQIMGKIKASLEKIKETYMQSDRYLKLMTEAKESELGQLFEEYNEVDRLYADLKRRRDDIQTKITRLSGKSMYNIKKITSNYDYEQIDIERFFNEELLVNFDVEKKTKELQGKIETEIILGQNKLDESFLDEMAKKILDQLNYE